MWAGGPANFHADNRLNAGWIAIGPSPQRLSGPRFSGCAPMAGGDVPVTVCQWEKRRLAAGIPASRGGAGLLELPTSRPGLRYLDVARPS